jgi:phosphoadenosine phosphosulfate reductase
MGNLEAQEWSRHLEGRAPAEIVAWAVGEFGDGLVVGSSFGKDGMVLIDLARRLRPNIPVLFLDTGYHFPETLALRDRLQEERGVAVVNVRPEASVAEQDARLGPDLFARDPDRCCALRKVAPLQAALAGRTAWLTGVRRSQHGGREATPLVEWQELPRGGGIYKVNPLAGSTLAGVEAYLVEHDLPVNPLWAQGYPSVGCAPCTVSVAPGEGERAGRWKGRGKSECGIHALGLRTHGGSPGESGLPSPT